MKYAVISAVLAAVSMGLVGCGGSDDQGGNGGSGGKAVSCLTSDHCFEVASPSDYDFGFECGFMGGKTQTTKCDLSGYDKKCTDTAMVSENDGPEREVTYVNYYSSTSNFGCFGEEADL